MSLQRNEWLQQAADGGVCRVTRIQLQAAATGAPVVLLPGMFTSRRFWLSDRNIGLAAFLAQRGHRCWMIERRGIGHPANTQARPGAEEHLQFDLPQLAAQIWEQTGRPAVWIGHSFGGQLAARAVNEQLPGEQVAGVILLATQTQRGKRWLMPPLSTGLLALTRSLGRVPARLAGLGPEDEPAAAIEDSIRWTVEARRTGGWPARLNALTTPVPAVASQADRVDPATGCRQLFNLIGATDKQWWLLGERLTDPGPFDHPGMVVSKAAQTHVWPRLADWIETRTADGRPADSARTG
ncbi:MAG: hypothetical protein CMH65_05090 [Nevskiales bacterium]|nr:hypothetical protein [Nevskiales bacterium]